MGELGERLRAAREAKELTIDQVAEGIRIQRSYLEALESESFGAFTSELHARGFLRNYASYLGLEPEGIMALYDKAKPLPLKGLFVKRSGAGRGKTQAEKAPSGPAQAPAHAAQAPSAPFTTPAQPRRGRASAIVGDLLLLLIGVVFLSIAGVYLYRRQAVGQIQPTDGPTPAPTAISLPTLDGTVYTMDINLNYAEHRLDVRQRIDYTNVTSTTLSDLMLNVHPNRSKGTFTLNDVKVDVDGEMVQPEVFPLDVTLRVVLPDELPPDEHVTLYLSYTLSLPRIEPDAEFSDASFGYSKQAISLGNWYPVMAPYRQDKGWYTLSYFPVGDPYVTEVADYNVTITATQGVIVAGTGVETHAGNRWHYEAQRARSFALAASDVYLIETAPVGVSVPEAERSGAVGGQIVYSYYFPGKEAAGRAALDTAAKAIELFTELYGPYPYPAYRLCETDFAGGLEFSGLTFLGSTFYDQYDGTARASLIPLTAHEVSHQWFYGLVGNDQVSEPWLDEALAQYSSYLYYERYLPNDKDWWWDTEIRQYAPAGKIDLLIYQFRNNRDYMNAVYRRGAEFIQDLRKTMGDPAFFGFLKEYIQRFTYQLAKSRDFFTVVQEFTTADLMPLQEAYFRQRTLP
jgi:transcriptional regulator with XRE-family HTH domain